MEAARDLELYRDRLECSLASPARDVNFENDGPLQEPLAPVDGFLMAAMTLLNRLTPIFNRS